MRGHRPTHDDEAEAEIVAGLSGGFINLPAEPLYQLFLRGEEVSHLVGEFSVDGLSVALGDLTGYKREAVRREVAGADLRVHETYSSHARSCFEAGCLPMRLVIKRVR